MIGMIRFNFTIDTGIEPEALVDAILQQLGKVPGLAIARNTFAMNHQGGQVRADNPPMPEFHKVKGIVRER